MSDVTAGDRANGDFERYGLVAALTVVILCVLLADRLRSAPRPAAPPPAERLLRIRIGGAPPAARAAGAVGESSRRGPGATPLGPAEAARPAVAPAPVAVPPPAARRTCVVGDGETMGEIARRELGAARRAPEIAALNGLADVNLVRAGQTLQLPPR